MRAFIVFCLVAVSSADKLGHNYHPVAHSDNGLSFAPGASDATAIYGDVSNAYLAPTNSAALYPAPSYDATSNAYLAPTNSLPSNSAPSYDTSNQLEKEFYTFSADEGEFEDANAAQRIAGSVKQGLRVVFIKGPENKGFEDAALALARQAAQQQTAIYVLNKQADIADLANKLNAAGKNANSKPEVHFIKYRTPDDAVNAQKAIQSQYDSLAGNSQRFNGGVAPVINFASQSTVGTATAQQPQKAYLPSSVFRLRL